MPDPATSDAPTKSDKPAGKLSRDAVAKLIKEEMPGLTAAGIEGVVRNVFRESGGDPTNDTGDHGTSGGLFQHHNTRFDGLKAFAKEAGTDWQDPRTQVKFAAKELKANYPTLNVQLQKADDPAEAEDSFKRVFERPASIMWANKPKTEGPGYRYSDYALGEHRGRKNTDMVYMTPGDYLDLSPDFEQEPYSSPSGKALKASMDRGDEIEAIPTLDMNVKGNTGMVTAQDGRHRALMAQEQGIDSIPVAIRKTGKGDPSEIQGLSGSVVPNDFPKAADAPKRDPSVWKRAMAALNPVSSAEAAEPKRPLEDWEKAPAEKAPAKQEAKPPEAWEGAPVASQPDGAIMSGVKGAAAGFGKTVLAGQELVGKGLEAIGAETPGKWLVNDARKGIGNLEQETAQDKVAHPWAEGAGEIGGEMAIPGGIAGKIGGNALKMGAITGAIGGALTPGSGGEGDADKNYWADKGMGVAGGALTGAATGGAGNALSRTIAPQLTPAIKKLLDAGIELTPGQMGGRVLNAMEDKAMSIPITGDAIKAARRRGIDQFNGVTINSALGEIGQKLPKGVMSGHEAIEAAQDAVSNEYNRILPNTRLHSDPTYQADIGNLRSLVGEMPPTHVQMFDNIYRNRVAQRLGPQGNMDGFTFKQVESELTTLANGFRRSRDMADRQLGTAIKEVQSSLRDAFERSNPGKRAEIASANRAYAKLSRAEDASMRRAGEGDGVFTPADLWQSIKSDALRSGRRKAFARGDGDLLELANAGQQVLPSKIPNSGTADRLLMRVGAGEGLAHMLGHGVGGLGGIAGLLAGAAPYTPPASKAMNYVMNRLAQPAGPTRNALAQLARGAGQGLAFPAGQAGAQAAQGTIPSMTIRPDGSNQ